MTDRAMRSELFETRYLYENSLYACFHLQMDQVSIYFVCWAIELLLRLSKKTILSLEFLHGFFIHVYGLIGCLCVDLSTGGSMEIDNVLQMRDLIIKKRCISANKWPEFCASKMSCSVAIWKYILRNNIYFYSYTPMAKCKT